MRHCVYHVTVRELAHPYTAVALRFHPLSRRARSTPVVGGGRGGGASREDEDEESYEEAGSGSRGRFVRTGQLIGKGNGNGVV